MLKDIYHSLSYNNSYINCLEHEYLMCILLRKKKYKYNLFLLNFALEIKNIYSLCNRQKVFTSLNFFMQINNKINEKLINFLNLQIDIGIEFSSLSFDKNKNTNNEELYLFFEKLNKMEKLDYYLKNLLKNKENNLILSAGNMSSKILVIADNPEYDSKELKNPFSGSSLILLTKMFGAINVSLDEIILISINLPNEILKKKSFCDDLVNFELIISRLIEIINPLFIVNMCIINNLKLSNLKTKSEKFDVSNPSLIINNPKLKKSAWEGLKLLKRKINENILQD